ncbi:dephospho-CoA kinase [Paramicrobacterium agarici]|uniref:dephospho-CoA kinase n=1 Tax=Paramicrobacterium agarici TaxID=630514 RepID=UPI0011548617|nr:dephospho-CoA kinase [Microbacterium agarici]TQO21237.1 dephospho-CoA kinase [Microbacterium agarici]
MLVGLTGGIASGKSTVAAMLRDRGAVIVDADLLAREAVAPGTEALRSIRERFGEDIVHLDGSLNRAALGRIVFGDAAAREDLNTIVHPAVRELAQERFRDAADADPHAIIVYDVPLLAETGMAGQFDLVVLADASAAVRRQRLVDIRGLAPDEASRRVEAQAPDDERRRIADAVIDTTTSLEATRDAVDELWRRLKSETDS